MKFIIEPEQVFHFTIMLLLNLTFAAKCIGSYCSWNSYNPEDFVGIVPSPDAAKRIALLFNQRVFSGVDIESENVAVITNESSKVSMKLYYVLII
jgi:hypothetical protein